MFLAVQTPRRVFVPGRTGAPILITSHPYKDHVIRRLRTIKRLFPAVLGIISATKLALEITVSQKQRRVPLSKAKITHKSVPWVFTLSNFPAHLLLSRSIRTSALGPTESCQHATMERGPTARTSSLSGCPITAALRTT